MKELQDKIEDLLRNIAGLDDRNLYISNHDVLIQAVKEWREEARAITGQLPDEDPSGQRREPSKIGWMGDISGNPFGPSDY
jgi:hypothetical protein